MRRMGFALLLGLVLIVSAFAVTLFASAPARAAPPFRSLRIGELGLQITTFNPLLITLTDEYVVVYNTYSTLATFDKDYRVLPDLAYNWSLAPDDVTWTFHLVHSAYFVDPTNPSSRSHPVTAADVVYSYNLNMNTSGSVFYTYVTELASVSAPDPYTVQIVTRQPLAAMSATLTNIPILPQYIWGGLANPLRYAPAYPVGSGPMYYDSTNSSVSLVIFRRSPSYYGPAYYCRQVRPDEVRFIGYTSSSALITDFLSGTSRLDAIEGIDPVSYTTQLSSWTPKWGVDQGFVGEFSNNVMTDAERAALIAEGYTQFKTGSNNQILATNLTVRTAVAMSINKTALVQDALLGLGEVADSLVPTSNPWHYAIPANERFPFNPSAARALLNAAGWEYDSAGNLNPNATPLYRTGGTNGLIFRFYTLNAAPEWQAAASDIVAWLHQAGIETTDRTGSTSPGYGLYSINQMSSYWLSADYDMWLWDWVFAPGSDPSLDILSVETSMAIGPTSDNFYWNSTYDHLYNESLVTIDPVARRNLTDTMQDMIYRYASYILPYYRLNLYAALNGTRWTNWGDWSASPGLAPDSDLPALWFQVEPMDNRAPAISSFPRVEGHNGTGTLISASASDPDGDPLNFTWTFGDGSSPAVTTSGYVNHTFASPGNYTLGVTVSDGEWLACANSTASIVPSGPGYNEPPILSPLAAALPFAFANGTRFATTNVAIPFSLQVQDPEGDPVTLDWFWGDGTTLSEVITGTSTPQSVHHAHAYANPGNYTVVLIGTDNQTGIGNHIVPDNLTGVLVLVDTTPPVTVAALSGTAGLNGWYTSAVQVTLTATDDLTGVAGTLYSVDGGAPQVYSTPFGVSADGAHNVTYASVDGGGNVETPKWVTFKIDASAPTTAISLAGTAGTSPWYTSSVSVTLTATDTGSGVAQTDYRVDGGAWQVYTAAFTVSGDGYHNVSYYSVNAAGDAEATSTRSIQIDATPPSASASVAGTAGGDGWYVSAGTVTLTASDATSGVVAILYSIDGGASDVYRGPFTVSDGVHTISYRALDGAGNLAAAQTLTVKVDTTPPILTSLAPSGRVTTSTVTVTWASIDADSGIAGFAVSVDGGAFQSAGLNQYLTLTLADGTHTITVRATDAAGNSVTQTTTFTVDTNIFSFTGPYGGLVTVALIVAVAVAILALLLLRRRRKASTAPRPAEPAAEPPMPPSP